MSPVRLVLSLILVAPQLAACDAEHSAAPAPLVRDSSGITIVENIAPRWRPGEGWRLSADPLVIGSLDGPQEYRLFRVAAAIRLSDGRILIGDQGTQELRFYGGTGEHIQSIGGSGSGPGEYRDIAALHQYGDSLFVVDLAQRRVSVLDLDGGFARSFSIPLAPNLARPSGHFGNGTMLFGGIDIDRSNIELGRRRDPMRYVRLSMNGEVLDTFGAVFEGPERITEVSSRGGSTAIRLVFLTFNPIFTIRAHRDRLIAALGRSYELSFFRPDGTPERLIRRPYSLQPITDAHFERYLAIQRAEAEIGGQGDGVALDQPRSEFFSAYGPVILDVLGNAWVSDYRLPWHEGPLAWTVFDPNGTWLGEVHLPDGFEVFEIGTDYLLGLHRDDLDVEYVYLYALDKSAS